MTTMHELDNAKQTDKSLDLCIEELRLIHADILIEVQDRTTEVMVAGIKEKNSVTGYECRGSVTSQTSTSKSLRE